MRLVLCLLCATFAAAQVGGASDEAAVREMVKRYADAREARDPELIGGLFTDNADQLVSTGEWRRGKAAMIPGMLASSARAGEQRTLTVETIRFIGADVAIADARYEIGDRKMWSTFIMHRSSGSWRIDAIRNMAPTAQSTDNRSQKK